MKHSNIFVKGSVHLVLIILSLLCLLPFIMILSVSLTSEAGIQANGYGLIPSEWSLEAYRYIFRNPTEVISAYTTTIFVTVVGTISGTLIMAMMAYPMSRRDFQLKNALSFFVYFTMLFSGGLVPTYNLYTQYLNLDDTIWVYILPALVNPWYLFMVRTFFADIPEAIIESAYIDGANEYTIFFRFVLPLSKPVLATIALFVFLGKWNDWYTSMLYINKENLVSLQYLLQRIMKNLEALQNASMMGTTIVNSADIPSETTRMAMAIVVAGPVLVIFPFFQKYFVRGMTVGSVKG